MTEREEALFRAACTEIAQEETNGLERRMTLRQRRDAEDAYRRHRKTVHALIRQNVRQPKSRLRLVLRTAACAAAAAVLLFSVLRLRAPEAGRLTGHVFPIPTSGNISSNDLLIVTTEYRESPGILLPGWELFPTYIPEGCTLHSEAETEQGLTAAFSAGESGPSFCFTQAPGSYLYPIADPAAEIAYVRLNGFTALRITQPGKITLVWDQEGKTVSLTGDAEHEEMLEKIAQSVEKIPN